MSGAMDVQGLPLAVTDEERCTVCMGEAGDDSRRCERLAFPLHRTHLVDGIYHLPSNTDEINAALAAAAEEAVECLCDWTPFNERIHPECPFHVPSVRNLEVQGSSAVTGEEQK